MKYAYDIIDDLGPVGEQGKRLKIVKWGNNQPKYDVRSWRKNEDGELLPGKGVTLTKEEARELVHIFSLNL